MKTITILLGVYGLLSLIALVFNLLRASELPQSYKDTWEYVMCLYCALGMCVGFIGFTLNFSKFF